MRKYIRNLLRSEGERKGEKPSAYVKIEFDKIQRRKYGRLVRLANQAHGTHKRITWHIRENIA